MIEIAGGAAPAQSGTSRVDYFNRLLKSRGGLFEAAAEGPPDLSEGAIQDRIVETGAELHRIVKEQLGDRAELHEIVNQIVAKGDAALRVLGDQDEDELRQNPSLVRDLEVIVRTDGSRPSFMIRNGAVDSSTSPIGDWQSTLDAEAASLQQSIACVGRIDDLASAHSHRGTGFLVQNDLIITNRHVLQAIATRQGNGKWTINKKATIDFGREHRGRESVTPRTLKQVVFTGSREIDYYSIDHKKLDLALIEIEPMDGDSAPTPFKVELAADWSKPDVKTFIIGYPGEPYVGTYEPTLLEKLFRSTFGFKRMAPGSVIGSNHRVEDWTVTHDCTTLGGNSGSVVVRIGKGEVAAGLHYGGVRVDGARDDERNLSENWGHVLGQVLDTPGDGTETTLREIFEERGVTMVDSFA